MSYDAEFGQENCANGLTSEEEDDECQLNTENYIRKAYTNNVIVSQGFISSSLYNESSG